MAWVLALAAVSGMGSPPTLQFHLENGANNNITSQAVRGSAAGLRLCAGTESACQEWPQQDRQVL